MFREARKRIFKYSLIKVLISFFIIIGILIASKFAPIRYLLGPTSIDINNCDIDKQEGAYVEIKIKPVFNSFMEEESYTVYDNGARTPERITSRYYITRYNEQYYLALRADGDRAVNRLEARMKDTWNTNDWDSFEEITLKGTVSKMDNDEFFYYESYLVDSEAIPADQINNNILIVDYIGPCTPFVLILCTGIIIIALLYALFHTIKGLSGRYMSDVKRFARKNKISIEMIEADVCELRATNLWVGSKYIAYLRRDKIRIVKISDYVWAYQRQTKHKNDGLVTSVVRRIEMFDRHGKSIQIHGVAGNCINNILQNFMDTQPHMVIGYNDNLKRLYQSNIEEFMKIPFRNQNPVRNDV